MKEAGFKYTKPYHSYVPSFGDWGFVLAANKKINEEGIEINVPVKYIDKGIIKD